MNQDQLNQLMPIAVVGIGCRFPGNVANAQQFWQMMSDKTDGICEIPNDRWNYKKFFHPSTTKPGKSYTRWGGFLQENIFEFDPLFFGISPREAEAMDPQQRYLLKTTYEALEDAGIPLQNIRGSRTGCFIGGFTVDNQFTQFDFANLHLADTHTATSSTLAIMSNRISHAFDLRGPSLSVDTACSSSLVATHLAIQSLRAGDCSTAIAGGVTIMTRPEYPIAMCNGGFLSKHGRCMAFDERAEGYTRGEGCGIVILKPLIAAIEDGDRIYSVIRHTGVNQDGATRGIAAPNGDSQFELIERVYHEAGLTAADVQVIEAHGTGTQAGDTTECAALNRFISQQQRDKKVVVGSVKTNIGHLEAAAGVAGLIKASLMLHHGQVLPNLHFETPNPKIPFAEMDIRIPTNIEPWPIETEVRRVSVNSFGYGGTNAHAVLESAPISVSASLVTPKSSDLDSPLDVDSQSRPLLTLPVSAQDESALRRLASRYADQLDSLTEPHEADDLIHTAGQRQSFHRQRLCVIGESPRELTDQLRNFVEGIPSDSIIRDSSETTAHPLVFVFTGMGPQWHDMGNELYRTEPVYRAFVDRADQIFQQIAGWSILGEMQRGESDSRMSETAIAQPANFILQAGLLHLLQHQGVHPDLVVGHSVGEVASAYASGALSLADALLVSFHRSRLQATLAGTGGMLAAGVSSSEMDSLLSKFDQVEIAAINSPESVTVAGCEQQLQKLSEQLTELGAFNRLLTVEVPYHSQKMEPIKLPLLEQLAQLAPQTTNTPMYSTVTAEPIDGPQLTGEYWWSNVRQAVRFGDAIANIAASHPEALFFEIGPHPVLKTSIGQTLAAHHGDQARQLFCLHRKQPERLSFYRSIAQLFTFGRTLNWRKVNTISGRFVKLPAYPWSEQAYLRTSEAAREDLFGREGHPYFFERPNAPNPTWEVEVNDQLLPWLHDHVVNEEVIFPGAGYVEAALALGYHQLDSRNFTIQDIQFQKVLVCQEQQQTRLRTSFDPVSAQFSIHTSIVGQSDSWNLHAQGKLIENSVGTPPKLAPPQPSLAEDEPINIQVFYEALESRGLRYGPQFRTVKQLRRLDDHRLVAKLEQQTEDESSSYILHPAMLDGAFQSMLALLPTNAATGGEQPSAFVPVSIDRIDFYQQVPRRAIAICSKLACSKSELNANIELQNEDGEILLRLSGVKCQALPTYQSKDPLEGLFYEMTWAEMESPVLGNLSREPWLVVGSPSPTTATCREKLHARGIPTDLVPSLAAAREQIDQTNGPRHIVVMTPMEYQDDLAGETTIEQLADVTLFLKGVVSRYPSETVDLHFITTNAFQIEPTDSNANVKAASLNALGVLVENEHPNVRCFFTDVTDALTFETNVETILLANDSIRERAIRGMRWYRQQIEPTQVEPVAPQAVTGSVHETAVALRQAEAGNVDSLRFEEVDLPAPRENEIKVKVHSCSLNFKDVLKVYGQIDAATLEDTYCRDTLGVDFSGTVIEVGANVTKFKVGDQVAALSPDSFRSQLNVSADYAIHRPDCLTMQDAASLLSYLTAWFGLIDRAGLNQGERVLIHNATGGVGSAAIQIAQWVGAEIYATAGTPEKRKHLRDLGIEHVYDSRTLTFKQEIERDTQGEGIDVVLNAIAGEAVAQSFDLLAPFGRFIEIGKKNIADNWGLPMRAFQDNLTFIAVDIDRLLFGNRRVACKLFADVAEAFQQGCFQPIPNQTYPIGETIDAIKSMARAQHLGKVTLQFENQAVPIITTQQNNRRIRPDGNYVVTGGTRGFGLEIAKWIGNQGAGKVTLVSRSGASDETDAAMQDLTANGTEVEVVGVDISQAAEVERLMQRLEDEPLPVRGIFHGAVVLRDDFISQLTRESLETVLRPKLLGALHLHHYTAQKPLDIFFCFSSISALVGNKGQAAYVVANAFLDALCQFRRNQGLAANSINWGAISDVGILSRKTDVAAHFEKLGLDSIRPSEACDILDRVLHADPIQVGAFRVDWSKWAVTSPELANPATRFLPLLEDDAGNQNGSFETLRKQLISECPENEELTDHVLAVVLSKVSGLLRIAPSQLDPGTSISHLGVDSLAAVELGIMLRQSVGVDFSAIQLMAGPSPRSLADQIVSKIAS